MPEISARDGTITIAMTNEELRLRLIWLLTEGRVNVSFTLNTDEARFELAYPGNSCSLGEHIEQDMLFEVLGFPSIEQEWEGDDTDDGIEIEVGGEGES